MLLVSFRCSLGVLGLLVALLFCVVHPSFWGAPLCNCLRPLMGFLYITHYLKKKKKS